MVETSIIIPFYNMGFYLRECLKSVFSQQHYRNFEIIIVDNASEDGTKEWIRVHYPECRLISNRQNLGFSKAVNQGISISKGEYILVLNADVTLESRCLFHLNDAVKKNRNIGMAGGVILYPDKKTIYSCGLFLSKARRVYNRLEKKIYSEDEIGRIKLDCFWPSGACAIYRREMLEDIKIGEEYFDEDFFFLLEDFDVAWRAEKRGWRGVFCPDAIAYHHGRVTFNRKYRQYLSFRNRYLLLMKNENLNKIMEDWFWVFPYDFARFSYLLINNSLVLKAIKELIHLYPVMMNKREKLRKYRWRLFQQ